MSNFGHLMVPQRAVRQVAVDLGGGGARQNPIHRQATVPGVGSGYDEFWGRITQVDPDARTAEVVGLGTCTSKVEASWLAPYAFGGSSVEGMDFIPREESIVLVKRANRKYVITGFYVPSSGAVANKGRTGTLPNHRGLRPSGRQRGDLVMGSVDGNYCAWTSDGAIEMVSRALTKFVLEPFRGLGRLFLKNYELYTEGGHEWWQNYQEGDIKSEWEGLYKDDPRGDKFNKVVIKKGKNGDIYELEVFKREDEDTFTSTFRMHVDVDGNVTVRANEDANITIVGDANVGVGGDCNVTCNENVTIDASKDVNITSGGTPNGIFLN